LRYFNGQRHIASSQLFNEGQVWIEQHDVEMFHSMHALQAFPILKPHHMLSLHPRPKSSLNILLDHIPGFRREIVRLRIIFQDKLGPDNQVYYLGVDPIRPIVVQDFDVIDVREGGASWDDIGPLETFAQDKLHDGAMLARYLIDVLAVAAEI
jgi:hypothetical protein